MAVISDIIDGVLIVSFDGAETTRKFLVTDIEASTESAVQLKAIEDPAIPKLGDNHPVIFGTPVFSMTAEVVENTPDAAWVTVTYKLRSPDARPILPIGESTPPVIDIGATVQSVQTNKNSDGKQITVSHTFPDKINPDTGEPITVTQGVLVDKQVAMPFARGTRREIITSRGIINKASLYVDRINATLFLGLPPKTWLCTGITGRSAGDTTASGGADLFEVSYEFQSRFPDTWDAEVVFIDPETGQPPVGLVEGEGIKTEQVSNMVDFAPLGLE